MKTNTESEMGGEKVGEWFQSSVKSILYIRLPLGVSECGWQCVLLHSERTHSQARAFMHIK